MGPLNFAHWGPWPPFLCSDATHAGSRVPLPCGSWDAVSLGCQPGSHGSALFDAWSVFGSPPFRLDHHCTEQEATDPESPKGGSQRACPPGVPTPRLLGDSKEWRCLSNRPCFRAAVKTLSLWVASPGDLSQPPLPSDRSLGRRPSGYSLAAWVFHWRHTPSFNNRVSSFTGSFCDVAVSLGKRPSLIN